MSAYANVRNDLRAQHAEAVRRMQDAERVEQGYWEGRANGIAAALDAIRPLAVRDTAAVEAARAPLVALAAEFDRLAEAAEQSVGRGPTAVAEARWQGRGIAWRAAALMLRGALAAGPAPAPGGLSAKAPPCRDCGTTTEARSPCPGCGVVVCQRCGEREGAFCCDGTAPAHAPAADAPAGVPAALEALARELERLAANADESAQDRTINAVQAARWQGRAIGMRVAAGLLPGDADGR